MTLESRYKIRPTPTIALQEPPARPAAGNHRRATASADNSWDAWFDGESVTADFLVDRDQPTDDAR
ncbi:hypothetical protein KDH83_15140, partial [Achromobacter sp. Marseille-Q0513]|uniref:hypothetical protein n=1 Tax=Achromobacter sp. Marseille-Q0513 TaxID=2829161 RepID=UPI001BA04E30